MSARQKWDGCQENTEETGFYVEAFRIQPRPGRPATEAPSVNAELQRNAAYSSGRHTEELRQATNDLRRMIQEAVAATERLIQATTDATWLCNQITLRAE